VLLAVALGMFAVNTVLETFVSPMLHGTNRSGVAMHAAAGEYKGFVPDLQRRTLMNVAVTLTTAAYVIPGVIGALWYLTPETGGGGGGAIPAGDINGNPVKLTEWLKKHKDKERDLVQGLKASPTWLITTATGIETFGINAICTHLGCVVPWVAAQNKYACPCHGSQYDFQGKVIRGPAPLSLRLCHTVVNDDSIAVAPWTEEDFRTNTKPWWKD